MGKLYHLRDYIFEKKYPDSKEMMLETVIKMTVTDQLEQAGFKSEQFTINEKSLKDYFNGPIINNEMDDTTICPYFDYITDDVIYRIETRLIWEDPEKPDEFYVDTMLFRLRDYKTGNQNWESFEGMSTAGEQIWDIGPGDYFALDDFDL